MCGCRKINESISVFRLKPFLPCAVSALCRFCLMPFLPYFVSTLCRFCLMSFLPLFGCLYNFKVHPLVCNNELLKSGYAILLHLTSNNSIYNVISCYYVIYITLLYIVITLLTATFAHSYC